MSNHEHHHHEDECCAHEAAPTEITLNASAAGNLQTTLQVAGVDCAEEVSLIHRALRPLGGVREVRVNIMSGKAIIAHDETIKPEVLIKAIGDAGLKAIREGEKAGDEAQQRQKQRLLSVSISGAFTLLGLLMHWTHFAPPSVALGCFLVAIISGGWFIAQKAVAAARGLAPDMNLLMTIAVLGAAGIGEWSEGAAVAFLFALSELLESFSVARARRAIQSLLKLAPQSALLKDGDRFDEVCSWERFCTFAREPERRKVGSDARVSVTGVNYEVDPDLAGETVMLWWGIFDNELYIEHGEKRFGPYSPIGGPIPLHRYRAFKKTSTQQRADRIEALAEQLALPRAALGGNPHAALLIRNIEVPVIMFTDPDPFQEFAYPNVLAAKRAIADYLAIPLAKLPPEQLDWINTLVSNTLNKKEVIEQVQEHLGRRIERESPC